MAEGTFLERLWAGEELVELGLYLDACTPRQRLEAIRALGRKDQAALYERATGSACTLERDFIPGAVPLREIVHQGKNSLPLFSQFQKRFCAPSDPSLKVAWGYNEQPLRPLTGPGYFVAREDTAEGGVRTVVVDYTARLPTEKPATWPKVLPNDARLSRFIYFGTADWMWRVSTHVTIGRARRAKGWMDNWFVLCRVTGGAER